MVIILVIKKKRIFSPKNFEEKMAILTQITASSLENGDHIG
jgi:hypothetical protein